MSPISRMSTDSRIDSEMNDNVIAIKRGVPIYLGVTESPMKELRVDPLLSIRTNQPIAKSVPNQMSDLKNETEKESLEYSSEEMDRVEEVCESDKKNEEGEVCDNEQKNKNEEEVCESEQKNKEKEEVRESEQKNEEEKICESEQIDKSLKLVSITISSSLSEEGESLQEIKNPLFQLFQTLQDYSFVVHFFHSIDSSYLLLIPIFTSCLLLINFSVINPNQILHWKMSNY